MHFIFFGFFVFEKMKSVILEKKQPSAAAEATAAAQRERVLEKKAKQRKRGKKWMDALTS